MISIGGRAIGPGQPPYVVAELSGNHNGSLRRALDIVDAVAVAGAHAVKLQTYTPDTLTIDCDAPPFRVGDGHELWGGESLYRLFERAHTPWEWHEPIFERARELGLAAFSAPFDPTAVELLEKLGAPAYKIASSEIVDLPLIRLAAGTGKPLIISTGMATVAEIEAAVSAAREAGCTQLAVLSCTASYPAAPSESNLRALPLLAAVTGEVVGLSDHTPGIGAALAAVALGACLIEKHVTLSRDDGGVDAAFSLEPAELAALVVESERAWQSLGEVAIGPRPSEREGLRFRRSLYVVRDVRAGEPVTPENVRSIRPAGGLPPDAAGQVMGRRFTRDVPFGTPLSWDLI
ncbi:N-acetylneuraminate synthase [[Actinomadura] parvosata subsp. kistnae]|uniref:Pseudaminic acid synthase n=1 Tax=[Actinomadura] parvosata subsp. kistnae TaxID=1909395 RepID=A0A1V0A9G8_9ACTN|nr:pseudaminic acid synthase [Nonomuraea sp. ATCC 55076]AQZ66819.1 pseudaminic acid synthase [Nonomuraea sp. ATCC 55076]SPL95045.1 N-acetylneuraminate synthase [Actinomadura parvosata subsp. kistnae]